MMVDPPLVTVIVLCFNHERFAVECLESIRAQTYKNVQVLITDDCSTDRSVDIIAEWIRAAGRDYKFTIHPVNRGICATLNEALIDAKGKYVSIVATDDVWASEKLTRQVAEMESLGEQVGVLYSDAYRIDEAGNELGQLFIEWHEKKVPRETKIFPMLLQGNFIPAMTPLIRRSALVEIGPYDELLCYEDFDMWLRLSQRTEFVFSDFISAKYRIVDNSFTRTVLWTKSAPRYRAEFLIYAKCLNAPNLSDEQRDLILARMHDAAENLRRMRDPAAIEYICKLLPHRPRVKALRMLMQAIFLGSPVFEKKVDRAISVMTYVARKLIAHGKAR